MALGCLAAAEVAPEPLALSLAGWSASISRDLIQSCLG